MLYVTSASFEAEPTIYSLFIYEFIYSSHYQF